MRKVDPKLWPPSPTTPFDEGARAKQRGGTWFDCPYTDQYRRSQWFSGWDSASKGEKHGNV